MTLDGKLPETKQTIPPPHCKPPHADPRPNYYRVLCQADIGCGDRTVEVECFDMIEALLFGFNLGNVLKYLWRAGRKTPDALEDLRKARVYLDREIASRASTSAGTR